MAYKDLREWLEQVDKIGELVRLEGIHWDLEASAVKYLTRKMVLFDRFPGYPPGYRVLASYPPGSLNLFFITANWSTGARGMALTRAWRDRLREMKPVPPKLVNTGPILENVLIGQDVDLFKFPVPRAFEREGGRYIGTGHTVILKDPDTGRVNLGTYRLQLHDKTTTGIHASEGKDGRIIMEKYHQQGQPCPVVAMVGIDPGLFQASIQHTIHEGNITELDDAGWLKGQPEEVIRGNLTGLPIPANAEIALEGEVPPGETRPEGPFAEWVGYSQVKDLPVIRVKAIYYRNDPILTVSIGKEVHPPGGDELRVEFQRSALIWDQMEKAGVRGIQGVANLYGRRLIVVSIKNLYAGHSRQAGLVASQCHAGDYGTAYIIVVDDDIDPSNLKDVMWAVSMRTEPKRAIQILDYCWASHLTIQDPSYVQKADYAMIPDKATYMSKVIIDACKPLEWDPSWHQDVRIDPAFKQKVSERWGNILSGK
jgi:4-hydroxy-3-polyprenylbenzoate decarboxylase